MAGHGGNTIGDIFTILLSMRVKAYLVFETA